MDIQMPVLDGLSATREIRSMAGFESLPIIALTAHAMRGDLQASRDAGMNGHLAKPIDPSELMQVLLTWMVPLASRRQDEGNEKGNGGGEAATLLPAGVTGTHGSRHLTEQELIRLPQLVGVDWQVALQRTNRNPALLQRLIRTFRDDHRETAAALRARAHGSDFDAIGRIAHGLKSAAAYLGAGQLSWLASEVEQAVRRGANDEALALVPDMANTLSAFVRSLVEMDDVDSLISSTGDAAILRTLMSRLAVLLRDDDSRAEDVLIELQAAIGPDAAANKQFAAVRGAVVDIEYDRALTLLSGLAATLCMPSETGGAFE